MSLLYLKQPKQALICGTLFLSSLLKKHGLGANESLLRWTGHVTSATFQKVDTLVCCELYEGELEVHTVNFIVYGNLTNHLKSYVLM